MRKSSPTRPTPGRSSPSRSRISAMSAPTRTTSRPSIWRRRRARAASSSTPTSPRPRTTAPPATSINGSRRAASSGSAGIDTRALTSLIRVNGMPNAVIAHAPDGKFDLDALKKEAREWPGLVGMDLVPMVTSAQRFTWDETPWVWGKGYGRQRERRVPRGRDRLRHQAQHPAAARLDRLQGHGGAGEDLGRGHRRAQARRRLSLQRPGRSGGDRRICRAGDPVASSQRIFRPSASASVTRCSASRSAARP